jgi:hypothetical protein
MYFEDEAILVPAKEPRVFSAKTSSSTTFDFGPLPNDTTHALQQRTIKAFRLDAIVGKNVPKYEHDNAGNRVSSSGTTVVPEHKVHGVAIGFSQLLAGLRVEVFVGEKSYGRYTFVRGVFRSDQDSEDDPPPGTPSTTGRNGLAPYMQHAVIGVLPKDIHAAPHDNIRLNVTYDGVDVPVTFMRVLVLGIANRVIG